MAALIADQGVTWLCKCGERPLRHHEHCDRCGEARPEPPPEPEGELSDIGRPDAVSGLRLMTKAQAEMLLHSQDSNLRDLARRFVTVFDVGAVLAFDVELPTTEPTEDGLLWNDNGVLTRSGPPGPDLPDDENEDEEC